jgi:hypothetical protein
MEGIVVDNIEISESGQLFESAAEIVQTPEKTKKKSKKNGKKRKKSSFRTTPVKKSTKKVLFQQK